MTALFLAFGPIALSIAVAMFLVETTEVGRKLEGTLMFGALGLGCLLAGLLLRVLG